MTNGCFDVLHAGHLSLHRGARGRRPTALVVAINSDASVRRLKGPERPVIPESERAEVLLAMEAVDAVVIYDDETPLRVVEALRPDVLAKGADWPLDQIVGRDRGGGHGRTRGARPARRGPLHDRASSSASAQP